MKTYGHISEQGVAGKMRYLWVGNPKVLTIDMATEKLVTPESSIGSGGRHLFSAQMPTEEGKKGILSENAIPPLFTGGSFI